MRDPGAAVGWWRNPTPGHGAHRTGGSRARLHSDVMCPFVLLYHGRFRSHIDTDSWASLEVCTALA